MDRLRIISISLGILATLALVSSVHGVESDDYYESLKDDDEVRKSDVKESVTEYPNGVNVIPGEAEIHYPIYSKIPKSAFSCLGRPAGFYADTDLRCQVWHTCDETSVQQSFLCTNGTLYSQDKRVCDWWYNVNCDPVQVNKDYEQNRDLFKGPPPKNQDNSYDEPSQNNNDNSKSNEIPSARKSNSQHQPQKLTYEQQQQQPQQRRPTNSASGDRPIENPYTEPEEYQQREQSQRPPQINNFNHNQQYQPQQQQQQQRTQAPTNRPTNSNGPSKSSQGTPVPEKKRVIVLRLPGPLPPGATIPPHILREYAESVLAAERAGKPAPTGLSPRPAQSRQVQEAPRPTTQAPQRPPQRQQASPLPPIVSAPFKPVVPYTPRPFSQFLEQASKYNTGQTRPQASSSQPIENPTQRPIQNSRPTESRPNPQVEQRSSPSPSRQELEETIRKYEESKRPSSPQPQRQSSPSRQEHEETIRRYEESRRSSPPPQRQSSEGPSRSSSPSRQEHEETIRRHEESRRPSPQPQRQSPEEQRRGTPPPSQESNNGERRPSENQHRQQQSQNKPAEHQQQQRQPQNNQNRQSEVQSQNRQNDNQQHRQQSQSQNRQQENRNRQPENQYRQPEEQTGQYQEQQQQQKPRPTQSSTPYPEKKAAVKPHKAPPAPPADPHKKFRHSTPRKHVNVKFAPKGQSSLEESEDERQFPEESRRPAYPFQFNNFHAVPHHISSPQQEAPKEDIHVKTAPVVQEKPRRRPTEFLKESFVTAEEYKPTTTYRPRTTAAAIVEDPIVHKLVVVARQGLKIKDPSQETTTTERAQDFRRSRYESVKVQNDQTSTQVTTSRPTKATTTTTQATTTTTTTTSPEPTPFPYNSQEEFSRAPGGTRRVLKVKKLRASSTTTQATRVTEDLGFDIYGRNPDEDEEEELIRAAQLYQEASEHYGKRRRPSQ